MKPRICVIGLGYVGLPLAIALARANQVIGFDTKAERIADLRAGRDRNGEVGRDGLQAAGLHLTGDPDEIKAQDVYVITVPTPVDDANRPDLTMVKAACRTVGRALRRGAIVTLESTVYPGVTEDICGPEIAAASGLVCGRDFFLGYSPERVNPGDREHTVDRITKVVAGQTPEVTERLAQVYGSMTSGGVFIARDIRTAEAAKVIENAQRDINIAFINEVAMIFNKLGLSVFDVLEAARTKWNFLPFSPGLVGGHCIGVDPYYLADSAQRLGYHPEIILAGRRINDAMGTHIADSVARMLAQQRTGERGRVLVLGLTFKENVSDLRNSKVIDLVRGLERWGLGVDVHDPHADAAEAEALYRIKLLTALDRAEGYECVIGAVAHADYAAFSGARLANFLKPRGLVADVKGMWRRVELPPNIQRWHL
ncbi:MAG TPA: nucleotide sugar dehydrogenase [Alphaproteobacteria bacterium]